EGSWPTAQCKMPACAGIRLPWKATPRVADHQPSPFLVEHSASDGLTVQRTFLITRRPCLLYKPFSAMSRRASRSIRLYFTTFSGVRFIHTEAGIPASAFLIRPKARSNSLDQC